MLDLVDETESSWVYDVLGTWMDRQIIPHEKYVVQVSHVIQALARGGKGVFVGRGAQFVLPRSQTFAVRIVASEAFRAGACRSATTSVCQEALDAIHRTDCGRRDFIRRFFRQDVNNPHLYDLVLNVEQLGSLGAAEQIIHAMHRSAG